MSATRADRVAAWATGAGIGLLALMLTWLAGNRLAALVWDPPVGPSVAFGGAILVGLVASLVFGRRLAASSTGRRARRGEGSGHADEPADPEGGRRQAADEEPTEPSADGGAAGQQADADPHG